MAEATPAQTSIDTYQAPEVTVQFRQWTMFENTAYQRGQMAGFSRREAHTLHQRGRVLIIDAAVPPVATPNRAATVQKGA